MRIPFVPPEPDTASFQPTPGRERARPGLSFPKRTFARPRPRVTGGDGRPARVVHATSGGRVAPPACAGHPGHRCEHGDDPDRGSPGEAAARSSRDSLHDLRTAAGNQCGPLPERKVPFAAHGARRGRLRRGAAVTARASPRPQRPEPHRSAIPRVRTFARLQASHPVPRAGRPAGGCIQTARRPYGRARQSTWGAPAIAQVWRQFRGSPRSNRTPGHWRPTTHDAIALGTSRAAVCHVAQARQDERGHSRDTRIERDRTGKPASTSGMCPPTSTPP